MYDCFAVNTIDDKYNSNNKQQIDADKEQCE